MKASLMSELIFTFFQGTFVNKHKFTYIEQLKTIKLIFLNYQCI